MFLLFWVLVYFTLLNHVYTLSRILQYSLASSAQELQPEGREEIGAFSEGPRRHCQNDHDPTEQWFPETAAAVNPGRTFKVAAACQGQHGEDEENRHRQQKRSTHD